MKINIELDLTRDECAELGRTPDEVAATLQALCQNNLPEYMRFWRLVSAMHINNNQPTDAPQKVRANAKSDAPPTNTLF